MEGTGILRSSALSNDSSIQARHRVTIENEYHLSSKMIDSAILFHPITYQIMKLKLAYRPFHFELN